VAKTGAGGTGFYTKFLALLLIALVIGLIFQKFWLYLKRKNQRDKHEEKYEINILFLFMIGVLLVSPVIFKYLGFVLGGGIFLIGTMLVLSSRERKIDWKNIVLIIITSIGILSIIYIVFDLVLGIPLPQCVLIS